VIREDIEAGVFAFFSALPETGSTFKTATRKLATWENVAPEDQPALFLQKGTEDANKRRGLPTIWKFGFKLYLYVHTGAQNDPDIGPSQLLNPLLDAIDAALTPDDNDTNCTLGGLVSHCAINGTIEIFPGTLGDEAVAIVPIEVLVDET
jgi:hypothetical protein